MTLGDNRDGFQDSAGALYGLPIGRDRHNLPMDVEDEEPWLRRTIEHLRKALPLVGPRSPCGGRSPNVGQSHGEAVGDTGTSPPASAR